MTEPTAPRRVIQVNNRVIGPTEPRLKNVRPRKVSDYPHVPAVYLDAARVYSSPLMMGPPVCDELIALLQHVFTEEEAGAVRHLGMVRGRTAAQVAKAEHRPVEQVAAVLQRLACEKHCIVEAGPKGKKKYHVLPIMPGMFEMVLIVCRPETLSDWHRRFIKRFEALYETGYSVDYSNPSSARMVRFLPVNRAIDAHPLALPSDHLAVVLDRFEVFGVGQCQCRLTAVAKGEGCGKPLENCMVMGQWAAAGIKDGWLRRVGRQEALEIKREAEAQGMVNWVMNVESTKGQCSCSCCGCCCHAMRMVNEFNAPALSAPPHFLPKLDQAKCNSCGRCAKSCPMGAITVDTAAKTWGHSLQRCIGCGQCAVACQQKRAITMEPVPDYKLPYRSWFSMLAGNLPGMLKTAWKVRRQRRN
jgi:Pyruvate/2-oxoacid:ferredoxin oxidoreductase delta subunit